MGMGGWAGRSSPGRPGGSARAKGASRWSLHTVVLPTWGGAAEDLLLGWPARRPRGASNSVRRPCPSVPWPHGCHGDWRVHVNKGRERGVRVRAGPAGSRGLWVSPGSFTPQELAAHPSQGPHSRPPGWMVREPDKDRHRALRGGGGAGPQGKGGRAPQKCEILTSSWLKSSDRVLPLARCGSGVEP